MKKDIEKTIENEISEEIDASGNKKKNSLWNNNFVRLLVAMMVLAMCAGIGVGIAVYEDRSNPTNFVAQYFGKFLVQRYEEMLVYSDVEDAFIPEGKFTELMKKFRKENDIGDYELGKPQVDDNGRYYVRVVYENMTTGQKSNWDIYLAQKKNLITNAFTEWKVDMSQYLVSNLQITVPSNMKLTIDGVEINDTNSTKGTPASNIIIKENGETVKLNPVTETNESTGDVVTYTIPTILKGTYTIKAFGSYTNIVDTIEINEDNVSKELKLEDRVVSDSYKDRVTELTEEFIQAYYDVVKDRKNSSKTLMAYLKDDNELKDSLKKYANKDIENIYWPEIDKIEQYSLAEREFSDIDMKISYKDKGKFLVECNYSFTYRSSTKAELYDSYVSSISGKVTVKLNLVYTVTGDKLKISSIKMERHNKKN